MEAATARTVPAARPAPRRKPRRRTAAPRSRPRASTSPRSHRSTSARTTSARVMKPAMAGAALLPQAAGFSVISIDWSLPALGVARGSL